MLPSNAEEFHPFFLIAVRHWPGIHYIGDIDMAKGLLGAVGDPEYQARVTIPQCLLHHWQMWWNSFELIFLRFLRTWCKIIPFANCILSLHKVYHFQSLPYQKWCCSVVSCRRTGTRWVHPRMEGSMTKQSLEIVNRSSYDRWVL